MNNPVYGKAQRKYNIHWNNFHVGIYGIELWVSWLIGALNCGRACRRLIGDNDDDDNGFKLYKPGIRYDIICI